MRSNTKSYVSIKSMVRQPWKAILFIGIIALVSFTFTLRAFEGLIVEQEISRIEANYHSVGRVMPMEDFQWCIAEVKELVEASPFVEYTESLRVIQGVMEEVYTPDFTAFTPYVNQIFVYGTLTDKYHLPYIDIFDGEFPERIFDEEFGNPLAPYLDLYFFTVVVDTVAVALPEHVEVGEELILGFIDYRGRNAHVYQQAQIGERYFLSGQFNRNLGSTEGPIIGHDVTLFQEIPPVTRGFSFTEFRRGSAIRDRFFYYALMLQPLNESEDIFLYPVGDQGQIETISVIERTTEEMEVLRKNIHTIFLRPSRNLTANPITAPHSALSIHLLEGRLIDEDDYKEKNPVAVIRKEFAAFRQLEVGDTLTITMRESPFAKEYIPPDSTRWFPVSWAGERVPLVYFFGPRPPFEDGIEYQGVLFPGGRHTGIRGHFGEITNLEMATGYITDRETRFDRSRSEQIHHWQEMETAEITLEIVGIYTVNDNIMSAQGVLLNHVYIPDSIVPKEWTQDVLYRNFSFALKSPADEERFLLEYQSILMEMGFWLDFIESGWEDFNGAVSPIRSGILVGVLAFSLLTLITFVLTIFIYFIQRRKEYAIMRALGMEKSKSGLELSLPLVLMGFSGLLLGSIFGWLLSMERARESLANVSQLFPEGEFIVGLHPSWFFIIVVSMMVVFLVFIALMASGLAKYSTLELLQGNIAKKVGAGLVERLIDLNKGRRARFILKGDKAVFEIEDGRKVLEEEDDKKVLEVVDRKILLGIQSDGTKLNVLYLLRLIIKQISYRKGQVLLTVAITLGFVITLSFMPFIIERNREKVEWLYDNTYVGVTIMNDPMEEVPRFGERGIPTSILRGLLELETDEGLELISSYFAVASYEMAVLPEKLSQEELQEIVDNFSDDPVNFIPAVGVNNIIMAEEFFGGEIAVDYLTGFDGSIFAGLEDEPMPVIISSRFMERYELNVGDYVNLFPILNVFCREARDFRPFIGSSRFLSYQIVGVFETDVIAGRGAIIPLESLHRHESLGQLQGIDGRRGSIALWHWPLEVYMNPEFNQELEIPRGGIAHVIGQHESPLVMIVHDDILRNAVEPLERNIAMMSQLYPIILGLSIFIVTGLTLLILLLSVREVAIFRVLGMSQKVIMGMLLFEKMMVILIGVLIGAVVSYLIFGTVNGLGIGMILTGGAVALVAFGLVFVRMILLRLLQTNE